MSYFKSASAAAALSLIMAVSMGDRAHAATYMFSNISTGSNATAANIGVAEAAFQLDTSQSGTDVVFKFSKISSGDASITDIYFDTTGLDLTGPPASAWSLGTDSDSEIIPPAGTNGVVFAPNATPPNLPGGNPIGFSADYSADSNPSNPGVAANGIDIFGEYLNIVLSNATLATVDNWLDTFALVAGIHVQSITPEGTNNDASLSLINKTGSGGINPNPIPLPAGVVLLLSALMGLGIFGRFRAKT